MDRLWPLPGWRGERPDPPEYPMSPDIVPAAQNLGKLERKIRIETRVNHVLEEGPIKTAPLEEELYGIDERGVMRGKYPQRVGTDDRSDRTSVESPIGGSGDSAVTQLCARRADRP
jgi:hypothetical protein